MSEENVPDAQQTSMTRRFIAWFFRPGPTPKLIAWLVGFWLVPIAIDAILRLSSGDGIDWALFARYTVALLIIGIPGVIWNERRWRKASSKPANEAAGLRE